MIEIHSYRQTLLYTHIYITQRTNKTTETRQQHITKDTNIYNMNDSSVNEIDVSLDAEVELGGVDDLDKFLKEREDELEKYKAGNIDYQDEAGNNNNNNNNEGDLSPQSISSDDINKRLTQLQSLIDDGMDGVDDTLNTNNNNNNDAMTIGEIKGNKLDFGSPKKQAGVALSSATLKSPPADDELQSRLQRLSRMLDDETTAKMPIGLNDVEFISGEELGKGLLDETSNPPEWHSLNVMLRQNGFGGFPMSTSEETGETIPDTMSLRRTVRELLNQWERRGEVVQELMLNQAGGGNLAQSKRNQEIDKIIERHREKDEAARRALGASEARLAEVEEELKRLQKKDRKETANYSMETMGLKQQLIQSEHRVKAKEQVIGRLQDRLEQEAKRHEREMKRSREIFKKFRGREARPSSAVDSKTLEVVKMYETQRDGMVRELEHLRREVRRLNVNLKSRENVIQRQDFASSWKAVPEAGAILERLEQEKMSLKLKAEAVAERESLLSQKIAKASARITKSELKAQTLEEENANLRLDLEGRPSVRSFKLLQKKCQRLAEQLSSKKQDENDERRGNWKNTDTRASIKRDRDNAKLNLNRLDTEMKEVDAIEIIKTVCRILSLRDPSLIESSIEKINKVIRAVPRMQAFVTRVCNVVLPQTSGIVKALPAQERMQRALIILDQMSENADDATDTSIAYKKQAKKAVQYNRSSTNSSRTKVDIRNDLKIENVVVTKPSSVMVDPNATSEKPKVYDGDIEQTRGGQAWTIPAPTDNIDDDAPIGVSVIPPRWKDNKKKSSDVNVKK